MADVGFGGTDDEELGLDDNMNLPASPSMAGDISMGAFYGGGALYYLAPEVLAGNGNTSPSVDWWATGVLCYELLVGQPPFYSTHSVDRVYEKIRVADLRFPNSARLSTGARSLIGGLLQRDPAARLGAVLPAEEQKHPETSEELPIRAAWAGADSAARRIKEHQFFGLPTPERWEAVYQREIPTGFRPDLDGPLDGHRDPAADDQRRARGRDRAGNSFAQPCFVLNDACEPRLVNFRYFGAGERPDAW